MPILQVLKANEQKRYESPPVFDDRTRKAYLSLTGYIQTLVKQLRTPTNKVFSLLLYGYFKTSNRFYTPDKFYKKDIRYISRQLKLDQAKVDFTDYSRETFRRIKQQVLDITAHFIFDERAYEMVSKEAYEVHPNQMKPR
jgi:hypothetical protein